MKLKRVLSTVLAIAMVLTTMGVTVFADGAVAEVNGATYATLNEAVTTAESGATVKVLADTQLTSELKIQGKDITIDLGGKKLTVSDKNVGCWICVVNSNTVITNGTIDITGVVSSEVVFAAEHHSNTNGVLEFNDVDITGKNIFFDYTMYAFGTWGNGKIMITNGSTVNFDNSGVIDNGENGFTVFAANGGAGYAIADAEIVTNNCKRVFLNSTDLKIENTVIEATKAKEVFGGVQNGTVSNTTVKADKCASAIALNAGNTLNFTDGSLVVVGEAEAWAQDPILDVEVPENATLNIDNGAAVSLPETAVVKTAGEVVVNNQKVETLDKVTIVPVAKIGNKEYATVDAAVAAAEDDTIKLLADTELNKFTDGDLTIDLGGNVLTVNKNGTIAQQGKTVTFKNGTVNVPDTDETNVVFQVNGDLVLDGVTANIKDADGVFAAIYFQHDSGLTLKNGSELNIENIDGNAMIHEDGLADISILDGSVLNINNVKNSGIKGANSVTVQNSEINITEAKGNSGIGTGALTVEDSIVNIDGVGYHGISISGAATISGNSNVKVENVNKTAKSETVGAITLSTNASLVIEDTAKVTLSDTGANDLVIKGAATVEVKDNATFTAESAEGVTDTNLKVADTATVTLKTDAIRVVFTEQTTDVNGNAVLPKSLYNIVLKADTAKEINRLTAAHLNFTFTSDSTNRTPVSYEIVKYGDVSLSSDPYVPHRYLFNFDGKVRPDDTKEEIVIGQVKFDGYGDYTFSVTDNGNNEVQASTLEDNLVDTYIVNGKAQGKGDLIIKDALDNTIEAPTEKLTINIAFPNAINDNAVAYQDMKVTISGGDLEENIEIALGSDMAATTALDIRNKSQASVNAKFENGGYAIEVIKALTSNTAYTVTVEGAGYRTAKYTVNMQEADKTLSFWNNVKTTPEAIEEGKTPVVSNFLAGDIVKDNDINIYDLSAVVSYFGEVAKDTAAEWSYAKYDLNRDGEIDSKDVAYVLVSWVE